MHLSDNLCILKRKMLTVCLWILFVAYTLGNPFENCFPCQPEVRFPDPQDCSQYYQCSHGGDVWILQQCPHGRNFDSRSRECAQKSVAQCARGVISSGGCPHPHLSTTVTNLAQSTLETTETRVFTTDVEDYTTVSHTSVIDVTQATSLPDISRGTTTVDLVESTITGAGDNFNTTGITEQVTVVNSQEDGMQQMKDKDEEISAAEQGQLVATIIGITCAGMIVIAIIWLLWVQRKKLVDRLQRRKSDERQFENPEYGNRRDSGVYASIDEILDNPIYHPVPEDGSTTQPTAGPPSVPSRNSINHQYEAHSSVENLSNNYQPLSNQTNSSVENLIRDSPDLITPADEYDNRICPDSPNNVNANDFQGNLVQTSHIIYDNNNGRHPVEDPSPSTSNDIASINMNIPNSPAHVHSVSVQIHREADPNVNTHMQSNPQYFVLEGPSPRTISQSQPEEYLEPQSIQE